MRQIGATHFGLVLAAAAVAALMAASTGNAQVVIHGLGVGKGCQATTPVFAPYTCQYQITNNQGASPRDTYQFTSVVDVVNTTPAQSSGNLIGSLQWVVTQPGASCSGG